MNELPNPHNQLTGALDRTVVVVWLILMVSTALSWYLGGSYAPSYVATVAIIIVAFFKVFLVGRHFLELREARPVLRQIFYGWTVVTCVALVMLYLVLPH